MHGHGGPRDHTAAHYAQILARREFFHGRVVEELLLYSIVVLVPAAVGERCEVVEDQAIFLGIEPGGCVGVAGAPGGAIVIDQLAEFGIVGGLLLCSRADKGQHRARKGHGHIEQPAPTLCHTFRLSWTVHTMPPWNPSSFGRCSLSTDRLATIWRPSGAA